MPLRRVSSTPSWMCLCTYSQAISLYYKDERRLMNYERGSTKPRFRHIPENMTSVTGGQSKMNRVVSGSARSMDGNVDTILDLVLRQFGGVGKGLGGKGLFAVNKVDRFYDRVAKIPRGVDTENARTSRGYYPLQG